MDLDLRSLRAFIELCADLSFTHTAARLRITQPQLSMRIRDLEGRLGFALFERSTRSVRITEAGQRFRLAAERLLAEADSLSHVAQDIKLNINSGLRLGAIQAFQPLRRRLMNRYMADNPRVVVEVETIVRGSVTGTDGLASGRHDAAFLQQTKAEPVADEYETVVLTRQPTGLVLPLDSPLAGKPVLEPEDLKGLRVAVFRRDIWPGYHDQLVACLEPYGAEIVRLPEASSEGIVNFARDTGTAVTGARWWDEDEDEPPGVTHRMIRGLSFHLEYVLARRRGPATPAAIALWRLASRYASLGPATLRPTLASTD